MQSQGVPKKRGVFNSQAKMSNHFLQSCNSPENSSILQNLRATQSSYSQTNQPFRYCCLYVANYSCFALGCKTRHCFITTYSQTALSYLLLGISYHLMPWRKEMMTCLCLDSNPHESVEFHQDQGPFEGRSTD